MKRTTAGKGRQLLFMEQLELVATDCVPVLMPSVRFLAIQVFFFRLCALVKQEMVSAAPAVAPLEQLLDGPSQRPDVCCVPQHGVKSVEKMPGGRPVGGRCPFKVPSTCPGGAALLCNSHRPPGCHSWIFLPKLGTVVSRWFLTASSFAPSVCGRCERVSR